MRYLYILLATMFVSISQNSISQTMSETEEFLERKLSFYCLDNRDYSVSIDGGYFLVSKMLFDTRYYDRIKISNIGQYKLKKHPDGTYVLFLYCKNKSNCREEGSIVNGRLIKSSGPQLNYFVAVPLKKSFSEEDMPERIITALLHWFELHGIQPTVWKDTF